MSGLRIAIVALLPLLMGCPKTVYHQDGYSIHHESIGLAGAEHTMPSPVHPAVLEYLFATPSGPFRPYFEASLRSKKPAASIAALRDQARAIAGGAEPSAEHYARARARLLADAVNRGLSFDSGMRGSVRLNCCRRVDRRSGKLIGKSWMSELRAHREGRFLWLMGFEDDPHYVWDLQYVPGAFSPDAELAYETVVERARPLHRLEGER